MSTARRVGMDMTRQHFLADSALARDQHLGVACRDARCKHEQVTHRPADRDSRWLEAVGPAVAVGTHCGSHGTTLIASRAARTRRPATDTSNSPASHHAKLRRAIACLCGA